MDKLPPQPKFDYAAFLPCGCLVGLCSDMGDKDTAKSVVGFIKDGCRVERMSLEQVRELLDTKGFGCVHEEPEPAQPALF